MSRAEVQRLIDECWEAPYGAAQIALADEAIRRADALGDPDLRFEARLAGTEAYQMGGEPAKTFVTFSWCLAEFDRDPRRFGPREDSLLRWYFKWVVSSLTRFPEVPLSRTHAVLDDMERRYRLGGHSLQAVHQHRWLVANHIGDADAADEHFRKWITSPRDENSDCEGCDPTDRVLHLADRGRDAEAVTLAAPVLAGRLTCAEQPQAILTALLLPYLRTGRLDEARDAHLRAYRAQRTLVADLAHVGDHVEFCALTGNEARGLEIVDRHLHWLSRAPSPYAEMEFAASAALVLRRITAAGQGDLPLAGSTVKEQAERLAARATDLAARFDARNGTGRQGARIVARLDAQPLVDALPLTAVDAAVRSAAVLAAPAAPADDLPTEPAELIGYAERQYQLEFRARGDAALARLDELDLDSLLTARRHDLHARVDASAERDEAAEVHLKAAIDGYAACGDGIRRAVAQARLGILRIGAGRVDDGIALVEEATEVVLEHGDRIQRVDGHLRRAQALRMAERPTDALQAVLAARALLEPGADPLLVASCAAQEALLHYALGQAEDSVEAAQRAASALHELGDPPLRGGVSFVRGSALLALGRAAEAAEAFGVAIGALTDPLAVAAARANRGKALLISDQPDAAVDELVEAVAAFVAGKEQAPAAFARFDLATAYHRAGTPELAAEMAEEAIRDLDALDAAEAANRCRYLLANAYRELGLVDQALAMLDEMAGRLSDPASAAGRGQVREEAAQLMYRRDQNVAAASAFAAAAAAYREAGQPLDETRALRWQALALRWAGDHDAALAALAAADARVAELPADDPAAVWERAMLGYDGAQVYAGAERLADALTRIEPAAGLFRSIDAFAESLQAQSMHSEVLLRLGRPYDAEPLVRPVVSAAPEGTELRANAAWLLAEALEAQGRADEAERIRREHGLLD